MKKFLCIFKFGVYHTENNVDYTYVYRRLQLHTQFDNSKPAKRGILGNKLGKY